MTLIYFCASFSHRFTDTNILNFLSSKGRSRSRSTIFAMTLFAGICKNLQIPFFTFLIIAKVRPVHMILTLRQAYTQKRLNLAILPTMLDFQDICEGSNFVVQICLKMFYFQDIFEGSNFVVKLKATAQSSVVKHRRICGSDVPSNGHSLFVTG